jgi:hypothetical protein
MSQDIYELVNQIYASHQSNEAKVGRAELSKISEDARSSLELDHPSSCEEWWSSLTVEVQQKWLANPETPTMHTAWSARLEREKAVMFGRASVRLSGFKVSPGLDALQLRYINGEIDIQDMIDTIILEAQRLR